ncbi:Maf family protein [Oceanithermus desulfurans]|uniref:Maf family protein n=1 Tax=Oceanithermus desulfurans TaxID=227924 RepID=UPI00161AFCB1|nr:Maf family protein [Oceanithermus desulfurans]
MATSRPVIVLASGSPRRRELLARLGLPHRVEPPSVDESVVPGEDPADAARRLAQLKVRSTPGAWVLAADTVVAVDGRILGKPRDLAENRRFLELLSGRDHWVHTGLALRAPAGTAALVSSTRVRFRKLADWEIAAYAASGEGLDKAGGYGIQEKGMVLVEAVEGDFFTVMGLPVARLWEALARLGYPLAEVWDA